MTAKNGFYGRDDVDYRKKLVPNSDEAYFVQVNKKTGDIEVWNEEFGSDKYVGVYKKDADGNYGEFEENNAWWGGARPEEKRFFKTDGGLKAVKQLSVESIKKDLIDDSITDENQTDAAAQKNAQEFIDDGTMTTDPNATAEEVSGETAQENLADLNAQNQVLRDSVSARANTRSGPGSFGDYSYPIDRQALAQQDFMKFTLLEYKPKGQNTNTQFGFGDRDRVGPNGESSDRVILGSCSLPIPGGIKDENGADWAGDSMNEIQIQAAGLARAATGASGENPADTGTAIAERVASNNPIVKKAIQETFAGKAVGVQRLMTRATGMIFNPNLELLFDKPVLRGFQFSFDLVPRSKKEALEVVRIIRFFKQGMAPIRSQSNLFLLSPNVFQIHYIKGDDNNRDHPYIGKMKECAMTNFGVDYTPQQNYSTLKDGFMTAYRITMQLKELEPVFNDDYRNDEDSGFASFREDPAEQAALNNTLPAQIGF